MKKVNRKAVKMTALFVVLAAITIYAVVLSNNIDNQDAKTSSSVSVKPKKDSSTNSSSDNTTANEELEQPIEQAPVEQQPVQQSSVEKTFDNEMVVLENGNSMSINDPRNVEMEARTDVSRETWAYIGALESNGDNNARNESGAQGTYQTKPNWGDVSHDGGVDAAVNAFNTQGLSAWGM